MATSLLTFPTQPQRAALFFSRLSLAFVLFLGLGMNQLHAQLVYALSGNNLISFDAAAPALVLNTTAVTGIAAGQTIEGMDCRPATGELYAIGYVQATGEARLYTVNAVTGVATAIGSAAIALPPNMGKIGFDFNPTVDRIRVTGSNNANFRLHPVTGAIAATDVALAFAAADPNAAANPSIGAVAYTNSYIGATATTLYNYDDSLNVLTTQIPPNNGTLNTVGTSGIVLNLDEPSLDLDIYFNASSTTNVAFCVANTGALLNDVLYTVNLSTGLCTLVGPIGAGLPVSDIAVQIDRDVPANVTGQLVYGLTANGSLVTFDSDLPGVIRTLVTVTGVATGQVLVGLDCRPATGELYALGYNAMTGEARLYTLNATTGAASAVGGPAITLATNLGKVGFDFNPTVDRIRVTSSSNLNYRLHPTTGALVATDGNLAFAAGDPNAAANPSIGAVAYTNSYIGATATTLYNYDDSLNVLTTQIPPNNGTLNTVGASGIVLNLADPSGDLDIWFDPVTAQNKAYLVANVTGQSYDALYTLNLTTGLVTSVGIVGSAVALTDIAVHIDRTVPATVEGQLVYAYTAANALVSFDSELPGVVRNLVFVSGLTTGQAIVGLDFRPATGELFALGYNATNGESQLYTVAVATGVATAVGTAPFVLDLGSGANVGFDFNPTVDRIRVVSGNNTNYRLNPLTGGLAATDGNLAFAAGDIFAANDPLVGAAAYTNSYNTTTTTTLYVLDEMLNALLIQNPPNNGTLNTVGLASLNLNLTDPSSDLDIYYDFATATNLAYCSANPGTSAFDLFNTVNLTTGLATSTGKIGFGIAVRDIAVFLDSVVVVGVKDVVAANANRLSVFPNPANVSTNIAFELPTAADVRVVVTDLAGRQVSVVADQQFSAGPQVARWNVADAVPGYYFVQLFVDGALRGVSKMVVQE